MVYDRYVQVGRQVLVNYGPDAGKLATVVDVIDHTRVLVDGPLTGVKRQSLSFKRLAVTPIKAKVARGAASKYVKKALEKQNVVDQWNKTAWAQKIARRTTRANLSDFDRFKVMIARKQARYIVGKEFSKLRKAAKSS